VHLRITFVFVSNTCVWHYIGHYENISWGSRHAFSISPFLCTILYGICTKRIYTIEWNINKDKFDSLTTKYCMRRVELCTQCVCIICNTHIVIRASVMYSQLRDIRDGFKANKPATDRLKTFYPQTIHLYKTRKHLLAADNYKKHTFYCVTEIQVRYGIIFHNIMKNVN
jgi:hypothetical protein